MEAIFVDRSMLLTDIEQIDLDEGRPNCTSPVLPSIDVAPEELLDAGFGNITGPRLAYVDLYWNDQDLGEWQEISLRPISPEGFLAENYVFFANKGESLDYEGLIDLPTFAPINIGTLDDDGQIYLKIDVTFSAGWNVFVLKFTPDDNDLIADADIVPLHTLEWGVEWFNSGP